jgi:23S rRNA pseudouridine1911/1915/1917 synthase
MDILFEDAHILVVNKPAMLSTQAPPIAGATLETAVRAHLNPIDPAAPYVGTVHRLDRPVSGVVLWAKTPKAARRLSKQFAARRTVKEYWAIVEGAPASPEGLWEDWLFHDNTGLGRVQVVAPGTPRGQPARTRFRLGPGGVVPEGCSWLVLYPETGRTHQLRVQAASRGMPVVGDRLYGSTREFPEGIALHARSLTVVHPVLEAPMTFTAPVPKSWNPFTGQSDATGAA